MTAKFFGCASQLDLISDNPKTLQGMWQTALFRPMFPLRLIQVWRFLKTDWMGVEGLEGCLSQEEIDMLATFRSESRRESFLVGRAGLRLLLSSLLDTPASAVRITKDAGGRPGLEARAGIPDFSFSLSHSGEWIIIGLSQGKSIGVDIELIRDTLAFDAISNRLFHPEEAKAIRNSMGSEKIRLFFTIWTMKEACLKAMGEGLAFGLNRFSVLAEKQDHNVESTEILSSGGCPCGLVCFRIPFEGMYSASIAVAPPLRETLLLDCSPSLFF